MGNVGCRVKRIVIGVIDVSNCAPASFGKGKHNDNDNDNDNNNNNRSIWLSVLCM